ncbi:sulfatase-like hydrolase/transferase [Rhodopirellula sallentina]|nr:sulfatase-like hydrolase/transferase [Rhodopirellula sallentina]
MRQPLLSRFLFVVMVTVTLPGTILRPGEVRGEDTAAPPNIVLIMADDLGVEGLGCYGGKSYQTPNLDRLAATGMRFEHAYAQPLCANTRLQLMTGLHNHRNWISFGILDPNSRTIGHYMRDAGYESCIAGKWQLQSYDPVHYPGAEKRRGLGMHPKDAGFDRYSLFHAGETEAKGSRYADPTWLQDGELKTEVGNYGPDVWVNYIDDFIRQDHDKPFFVYYPMALPHWPMTPTPDSPSWQNVDARSVTDTSHFPDMVRYMDKCVGKVLDTLDQAGVTDNTLVLFYSDNGTDIRIQSQTGEGPVDGGKGATTDAGTHVPLIVRWPGKIPVGVTDTLVDSTDFIPTLLEASGNPLPSEHDLDGRSFFPQLIGDENPNERLWVYSFYDPRPGWDKDRFGFRVSARDQRWKLYDDGRLFDIQEDVLEEHPISPHMTSPATDAVRARLASVIEQESAKRRPTQLDVEHTADGERFLVVDPYTDPDLPGRKATRGHWTIENGTASVAHDDELYAKYNKHGPLMLYEVPYNDAHSVVDIRPDGCRTVVFTMDAQNGGHAFRIRLRTRPADGKFGPPSQIVTYGSRKPGEKAPMFVLSKRGEVPYLVDRHWNRIEASVVGDSAVVTINGETVRVEHPRIAQAKRSAKIGFSFGRFEIREFRLTAQPFFDTLDYSPK